MTETVVRYILVYYMTFWILNVMAYGIVSIGLYRWKSFVEGMGAERMVNFSLRITATFALLRITAGFIGIGLYELDKLSALVTILVLGVTSLLLNTTFIMTEGWFLNREAKAVWSMPEEQQATVKQAIRTFDSLRRANAA